MSRIIIGAYAHVDAGKTTLSEAILHKCGVLKKSGRVDHEDSFLDYEGYERKKGITVFAKEARFSHGGKDFVYVDTPGHLDFLGEVNRSLAILDAAILVIDASSPVPADTVRRFSHLKTLRIPVFLFLNKMDIAQKNEEELIGDLKKQLDPSVVSYKEAEEAVCLEHEGLLDVYLEKGEIDDSYVKEDLRQGLVFPVFCGCALREEGIGELLDFVSRYTDPIPPSPRFKAYVYKSDEYAHIKVFSGTLRNRDSFGDLKVSEIVQFNGNKATQVQAVTGSDLCAVKGLQDLEAGTYLPSLFREDIAALNTLTYSLSSDLDDRELYRKIEALNREFPELNIRLGKNISIDLTGELQQDFIQDLIKNRYGIDVSFSRPVIGYRESIASETFGVGHYEPLRHYGEVLVSLKPSASYKVKGKKEFSVLIDYLNDHRPCGLLTDSPLDRIEIEILSVKTHLKHTEGGDLVQSLDRAIRQGLSKTKGILLEPYYLVSFSCDQKTMNGIIGELTSSKHVFDIEENMIMAKIDKRSFSDFILTLRNRYKDDFSHNIEGEFYDRCRNEEEVIQRIGYDPASDPLKPMGSVFTRNGAGVYVPPGEVEENMHIELKDFFKDYSPPVKHNPRSIGEEEMKRIWNSLYKPKPRFIERNFNAKEEERKTSAPDKPLVYLIDAYNLMHQMEDVSLNDLHSAREKVIDLVCDFAGYVAASCILVFDAYLQDAMRATVTQRDNITLVYTKAGQTADMYIEAKAREMKDGYKVTVVTSDALEQLSVFSSDAFRLSSREFLARYSNMKKNMTHIENPPNRPLQELRKLLDE